jgi:outer membrane protein OmpA-like peptidoglycan-associated protein
LEDKINAQPKYILCTKSKSQHRKAIEVCHQCDDRQGCDEYQQVQQIQQAQQTQQAQQAQQTQQPELVQAMNTLMLAFNKKHIRPEDAATLKKAVEELSALCK